MKTLMSSQDEKRDARREAHEATALNYQVHLKRGTDTFTVSLFIFSILETINDGEGNANTSTIRLSEELEDPSIICYCTSVFNTIVPTTRTPPTIKGREVEQVKHFPVVHLPSYLTVF